MQEPRDARSKLKTETLFGLIRSLQYLPYSSQSIVFAAIALCYLLSFSRCFFISGFIRHNPYYLISGI